MCLTYCFSYLLVTVIKTLTKSILGEERACFILYFQVTISISIIKGLQGKEVEGPEAETTEKRRFPAHTPSLTQLAF